MNENEGLNVIFHVISVGNSLTEEFYVYLQKRN